MLSDVTAMTTIHLKALGRAILCLLLVGSTVQAQTNDYPTETSPDRGVFPTGTYQATNFGTVNVANGNLSFSVPLAQMPAGRAGFTAGLNLTYNSLFYDLAPVAIAPGDIDPNPPDSTPDVFESRLVIKGNSSVWDYGYEYGLELETRATSCLLLEDELVHRLTAVLPSGASHVLHLRDTPADSNNPVAVTHDDLRATGFYRYRPDGVPMDCANQGSTPPEIDGPLTYFTTDGSYIQVTVSDDNSLWQNRTWTMFFPDGTRVVGKGAQTDRIYDRNGNYLDVVNYINTDGTIIEAGTVVTALKDEFGREIKIARTQRSIGSSMTDEVSQKTTGGATNTWTVSWDWVQLGPASYHCGDDWQWGDLSCDLTTGLWGVDGITFPDAGSGAVSYSFAYKDKFFEQGNTNYWGELAQIITPAGATIEYIYEKDGQTRGSPVELLENAVVERTITYAQTGGQQAETTTYAYTVSSPKNTAITGPDGGTTTHWFHSSSNGDPKDGLVYRIDSPNGDRVQRFWEKNQAFNIEEAGSDFGSDKSAGNPYVRAEYRTLGGTGPSSAVVRIVDKNGNTVESMEYGYGVSFPADSNGAPTGTPSGGSAVRTTESTYTKATAQDGTDTPNDNANAYWYSVASVTAPRLLNTVERTDVHAGTASGNYEAVTEFDYDLDGNGNPIDGNPTEQRQWISSTSSSSAPVLNANNSAVTETEYGTGGIVIEVKDPNKNVTSFTYGSISGCPLSASGLYPTAITEASNDASLARTSNLVYDCDTGQVTSTTDFNSIETAIEYDNLWRPTKIDTIDTNDGSTEIQRLETYYDDPDRTVATRTGREEWDDGLLQSVMHYDQLGRPMLSQTSDGSALLNPMTGAVTAPTGGIKVVARYYTSTGGAHQVVSNPHTGSIDGWTCSSRDEVGRPAVVSYYSGSSEPSSCTSASNRTGQITTDYQNSASGLVTTVEELASGTNKRRRSVTDALGRLIEVTEDPDGLAYVTSYSYDVLDNLETVDQGLVDRSFGYDSLSRLRTVINPETGTTPTVYTYDANGNLETRTDARGVVLTNSYNALSQLTTRTYSDPGTASFVPSPAVTYEYGTAAPSKGLLTTIRTAGLITKEYEYDNLGRITKSTQTTDGQSYAFEHTYNADDSLATMKYPLGKIVSYGYDNAGRVTTVGKAGNSVYYLDGVNYAPHGGATLMKLGNTIEETATYNSRLQPDGLQVGPMGSLLTLGFDYNATNNNGNLLSQTITAGTWSVQQHYGYDPLNRINIVTEGDEPEGATSFSCPIPAVENDGVWCRQYGYDRYGNRWIADAEEGSVKTATPAAETAYGTSNNRLEDAIYDDAGNLTAYTKTAVKWSAAYDGENKQRYFCAATEAECVPWATTPTAEYVYDGEGNRVKKIAGGQTTVYAYDGFGRLAAEYSTSGPALPADTYFRTTDHLGSTRLVTNSSGSVYDRRDYYPFGEEIPAQLTTSRNTGSIAGYNDPDPASIHMFTGKERDDESDLDYSLARYFSANLGRFTSADAPFADQHAADPRSWNLYSYVRNNPLVFVDPTGRCSRTADGEGYVDEGDELFDGPCADGGGNIEGDDPDVAGVSAGLTLLQYNPYEEGGLRNIPLPPNPSEPEPPTTGQRWACGADVGIRFAAGFNPYTLAIDFLANASGNQATPAQTAFYPGRAPISLGGGQASYAANAANATSGYVKTVFLSEGGLHELQRQSRLAGRNSFASKETRKQAAALAKIRRLSQLRSSAAALKKFGQVLAAADALYGAYDCAASQ